MMTPMRKAEREIVAFMFREAAYEFDGPNPSNNFACLMLENMYAFEKQYRKIAVKVFEAIFEFGNNGLNGVFRLRASTTASQGTRRPGLGSVARCGNGRSEDGAASAVPEV